MKSLCLIFCLLITYGITHAQNYRSIRAGSELYYKNVKNSYRGIRIDSAKVIGQDTMLYNLKQLRADSTGCYSAKGDSWIGRGALIRPDGTNVFFNIPGDSIFINTQAAKGDSWFFYRYNDGRIVKALVVAHDTLSFLGLKDSVKTIRLQLYDTDSVTLLNKSQFELKLSKNYGLLTMLNFYLYPDSKLYFEGGDLEIFTITGLTNPSAGWQNLTARKIFDYEVGDEIHEELFLSNLHTYYREIRYIKKILQKETRNDSIIYEISEQKQSLIKRINNQKWVYDDSSLVSRTYQLIVNSYQYLDGLPLEAKVQSKQAYPYDIVSDNYSRKLYAKKLHTPWFWTGREDCYGSVTDAVDSYCLEGVGCGYHDGPSVFMMVDYFKPVYYKKGSETWGKPLNFDPPPKDTSGYDTSSVRNNNRGNDSIHIYPNPVHDLLTVEYGQGNLTGIELFDTYGKQLKSYKIMAPNGKIDLDLSELPPAIYIVKLTYPEGQHVQKVFKD